MCIPPHCVIKHTLLKTISDCNMDSQRPLLDSGASSDVEAAKRTNVDAPTRKPLPRGHKIVLILACVVVLMCAVADHATPQIILESLGMGLAAIANLSSSPGFVVIMMRCVVLFAQWLVVILVHRAHPNSRGTCSVVAFSMACINCVLHMFLVIISAEDVRFNFIATSKSQSLAMTTWGVFYMVMALYAVGTL